MATIGEITAWEILRLYSGECSQIDPKSLIAIYATGSLPGGYYRPGQSDIDAVLIVSDGSEATWGNSDTPCKKLAALNQRYKQKYRIPKDFSPFPLQPRELHPPYDPDKELTLEIAQLKLHGKLVYGTFSLNDIPMPAREDFLKDFRHFEEYWENNFSINTPVDRMTSTQCANTILMHLHRYLIIEKGTFEFDKRQIIPSCIVYDAPFLNKPALDIVQKYLLSEHINQQGTKNLRQYVPYLRYNMNKFLKIRSR
jgi:hypothetical protein